MSDYGTMKSRIQNELNRGNLTDEIANAIISALRFYRRQRFRWNTARTTTTLTDGVEYYGLPPDFLEGDTMVLSTSNGELDWLYERSHFWIDQQKDWSNYTSRPYVYSVQADELRLYPTPDAAYTLTLTYTYELDEPTDDTDTSAWFTDGEELIRTHAKVDLLENVVRGQESLMEAQVLRGREEQILSQLRREYKRSQSSGNLTPNFGRI